MTLRRAAPRRRAPRRAAPRGAVLCLVAAAALAGCADLKVTEAPRGPVQALGVDEAEALRLLSAYRAAHGRGAVALDPRLALVARRQADAMARADALSHTLAGPLPARLADAGADRGAAVENVSAGYASLEAALAGWRRSPAHDANLLFGPVRRMGIAAARAPATRFKTFWALVMTD